MSAAVALTAALLCWALLIAIVDGRQRRVPNLLLGALLVPAVAVLAWRGTGLLQAGWTDSLLGLGAALLISLPGYALSKFGAGDVKLAAVLGFVTGWPQVLHGLLVAALLMGLAALALVLASDFARVRKVRVPTAWTLLAGFAAVWVRQAGGW